MRLIDADALKEQFVYTQELRDQRKDMPPIFHEMMENICNIIIEEIDNAPTIGSDYGSILRDTGLDDLRKRFDKFLKEEYGLETD